MKTKKLTWLKRGSALAIAAAVCVGFAPSIGSITEAQAKTTTSEIVCDISYGDVIIGNTDTVSGNGDSIIYYDEDGTYHESESISNDVMIVVTGSTTEHTIMVRDYDDSPIQMTFRDLTIDVSAVATEDGTGYESMCAVYLGGESGWEQGNVDLYLEGSNTIKSADYAGIAVPVGETVTINGDGSLDVSSVAINSGTSGPAIGAPVSSNNAPDYITSETCDTSFGTIIINSGTITATASASAIGGSQGSLAGNIVINGGDITATAGDYSAAAIGCGQDATIGSILITGGTITATGSSSGPGIGGGGMHTDSGIITITGGTIYATGGNYAPGIGGSGTNSYGHGWGDQITITGGTIYAYGGLGAAGIGAGGPYGVTDTIMISGGTIYAYGGAGSVTEGDATQRSMSNGQMTMTVVGTKLAIYAAGAGIGNSGAYAAITTYTSGDNAGTPSASSSAEFGGTISITGGEIYAYAGEITEDELALLDSTDYEYVEAEAIGNGGYTSDVEESYEDVDLTVSGDGIVYEDGDITYASLLNATITGIEDQVYTGEAITLTPVVTIGDVTLEENTDYTVSYENNIEMGAASVTITGTDDIYTGSVTSTFGITAPENYGLIEDTSGDDSGSTVDDGSDSSSDDSTAAVTVNASKVKSIKVGKKKMTVTVKKVSGATGYEISYRVKGTKKWTTLKVTSKKTVIKNLKKGKKYQVKVTAIKKVGKVTYSSKASAVKTSKKIK